MLQTSNLLRYGYWVTVNENARFTDYTSGLRLPNCSKLAVNPKNDSDVTNPIKRHRQTFLKSSCSFFQA